MVYLFYSKESFLIKKEIDKIIKDNNIDLININTYDLNSDSIKDVIDDAETFSMFDDKKIIIVNNSYIFATKKGNLEQDTDLLLKYLDNINPSTILIFNFTDSKVDEKKKIVKSLKNIGVIKDLDSIYNINSIIKDLFNPYTINDKNIKLLIERVGTNLNMLSCEIGKIKAYKDKDLNITSDDINKLTHQNIEADMFLLVDTIINNDKEKSIQIYKELINNNEEPIAIIITLANKIRNIYITKELLKKGYSEVDIAGILGVKPGYLYYLRNSINKYDSYTLYNLLSKLADLDYNIKTNKIDKYTALELFILEK